MTTFDDREKAHEAKYVLDQETAFKVVARRNKLLGLWAADRMGRVGAAAEDYAKEVIVSDFQEAGDDDVLRKVHEDMRKNGVNVSEQDVRRKMDELLATAREQIVPKSS